MCYQPNNFTLLPIPKEIAMKRWLPFLMPCCGFILLLVVGKTLYWESSAKANSVTTQQTGAVVVKQAPVTDDGAVGKVFLPIISYNHGQALSIPLVSQPAVAEPAVGVASSTSNCTGSPTVTAADLTQIFNVAPSAECPDDITQDTATLSVSQPLTKSESYFFTDTGYQLDQYLFRHDIITTTGRLIFAIDIDRYYSPYITTTALITDGLVDPGVITNLIDNHLLPPTATLTLELYDIDDKATGCAEVDHIYLNHQLLIEPTSGVTVTINGKDQDWVTRYFEVPIGWLRFPVDPGNGGARPTALNEVAIDINTHCPTVNWALKVDWGAITIQSPLHRPVVFVHGYADNARTFSDFEEFAKADGIPTKRNGVNLALGIEPITATAALLQPYIDEALQEFGVDQVNLFAHSKGGLVSRYLLRSNVENKKVENLFTFGSPHHGHPFAPFLSSKLCPILGLAPADNDKCKAAANEMSADNIRTNFNYNPLCQRDGTDCVVHTYRRAPNVLYYTLVGPEIVLGGPFSPMGDVGRRTATYPWNSDFPYPNTTPVVDAFLNLDHFGIRQDRTAFDAAIDLLIPHVKLSIQ
jgi:pimeloyl-ACP methyl ester carboxylesterase